MSRGEKFLKNILLDMNLKIDYLNSKECFIATDKELTVVYEKMFEHSLYEDNIIVNDETSLSAKKLSTITKLFEDGKITVDTFEKILLTL